MRETPRDLEDLQRLLDDSVERAGEFLRKSFEMPERSLPAARLVGVLEGSPTVSLATTTARGEPRVAPVGALFYRGRFVIPTVASAARARHVRKRPAVSLTYYSGNEVAVIVHGRARVVPPGDPPFEELDALQKEQQGASVLDWGEGIYLVVEADVMYTYARETEGHGGR